MATIKKEGEQQTKFLNNLEIIRKNKIFACNSQWMQNGQTFCDLYNRSNKRRIKIKTSILFSNPDFIASPENYLKSKDYFKNLTI
jgi:hypothetical protein